MDRKEWQPFVCSRMDGPYWKRFKALKVPLYPFTLRKLSPLTFFALYRFLKNKKPDLIHTHGKGPGLYGRVIARLLNIPSIHTFHGFHFDDIPPLKRKLHLFVENFLSRITNWHIFVGETEKERSHILSHMNRNQYSVIPNGVDAAAIEAIRIDRAEVMRREGLKHYLYGTLLGTVSRLSPEKGIHILIEGFALAVKKNADLRLIIIGGSLDEHKNYEAKLVERINELQLESKIAMVGAREDGLSYMKCLDYYISPSLSEGLPLSLLEAFSARVPVLASAIPGNEEVMGSPACGTLFLPNSPEALAQTILATCKKNHPEIEKLNAQAFSRVSTVYSAHSMAEATFKLYQNLAVHNPQ
ncbi:MAG: glycosyltransferase [Candidatus Nitrohelix vancouverensis]|uniref:Glycosyltransferase n=1 Tax=Candidatus Nitrohelix vancouverensis TaxID=2705534 RepID=A0A7T0C4E9_9BACT|nr:MAG: glycosyltransferase [Candidatus Nitrohelix vancouverensis]